MTPAQLQLIKTEIQNDATLNSAPNNSDGADFIARELNKIAVPDFLVWRTEAPVGAVYDAISWDKFTPTDAADSTVTYSNRLLAVQTKQMNLQNMLVGRETIDASKTNVRLGLRDAVIALPTGVGGAAVTAGGASGVNVLNALTRKATRVEKVLATGSATSGTVTANLMGFEGAIQYPDVEAARAS